MKRYLYLGDAQTRPELVGMPCGPVRRTDGRCIVSTRMATALVEDARGVRHVVKRRRLRLASKLQHAESATPVAVAGGEQQASGASSHPSETAST